MGRMLVAWVIAAGCYDPSFTPCTVRCSDESNCPAGLRCMAGYCAPADWACESGPDGSVDGAAEPGADASSTDPDAAAWSWLDGGTGTGPWCGTSYCAGTPCCVASPYYPYQCASFCQGYTYWCDGPEDCAGECCFNGDFATCSTSTCPVSQIEVCHFTTDCDAGETCQTDPSGRYRHCL